MREEAVPVVGLRDLVPGPVGFFGIGEDDAGVFVEPVGVAPDVEIALRRTGRREARGLKPGMLVGGVVDDQLDHHLHAALMGGVENLLEIVHGAVAGIDVDIVGDVVAVVAQGRGKERQQPDAGDAKILQIVQLREQAAEVADAVAVGVGEGPDVQLVDDRVLVPQRIGGAAGFLHSESPPVQVLGSV